MRYGTLPIVHEIGGLKDTVIPFNPISKEGTGFGFVDFEGQILLETINRALEVYGKEPEVLNKMVLSAMSKDFSWGTKAQQYIELYQEL